jgi:hypothetical protein
MHGLVWYDDPIIVTLVLLVVIIAVGTVVFAMRRYGKSPSERKKQPEKKKTDLDPEYTPLPFKVSKSVQTTMASDAKNELRMLDLERDILGDALRKLYEAHAEGKITEQERDKLAVTYKNRMNLIKESITKDESIVALHELEGMQEDLMKLFSERFGELTSKVEELRTRIDVKPIREIPIKMPAKTPTQIDTEGEDEGEEPEEPATGEDKTKKKRKPPEEKPDAKTEAERRIESIKSEVERVLDKLGQMEIES